MKCFLTFHSGRLIFIPALTGFSFLISTLEFSKLGFHVTYRLGYVKCLIHKICMAVVPPGCILC